MISAPPVKTTGEVAVGMGQAVLALAPARLTTILGSCVAVTLYATRRRLGMLSHVVLPQAKGSTSNPAKFADTAVPNMLLTLKSQGLEPRDLTAKLVGGASMFGTGACANRGRQRAGRRPGFGGRRHPHRRPRRGRNQRPPDRFRPRDRLHYHNLGGPRLPNHIDEGPNRYGKDLDCD